MTLSLKDGILPTVVRLFNLASVYHGTDTKLEVEKLFYLPSGISGFVERLSEHFILVDSRTQQDDFWDTRDHWLTSIDAYLRLRSERRDDEFLAAEIKAAYPGAASNANVRPAIDVALDQTSFADCQDLLGRLDLVVERMYQKERVKCKSVESLNGCSVELEVDHFQKGAALKGHSFVGFSAEVLGKDRDKAEAALDEAILIVRRTTALLDCGSSNYEDFYYGRAAIPRV